MAERKVKGLSYGKERVPPAKKKKEKDWLRALDIGERGLLSSSGEEGTTYYGGKFPFPQGVPKKNNRSSLQKKKKRGPPGVRPEKEKVDALGKKKKIRNGLKDTNGHQQNLSTSNETLRREEGGGGRKS